MLASTSVAVKTPDRRESLRVFPADYIKTCATTAEEFGTESHAGRLPQEMDTPK